MSNVRGFRNWHGWRRIAWLTFGLLFFLSAVFVFFPNSILNQQVAAGLTGYLVNQLGPEAICGDVEMGWRHISLRDIVLPLNHDGTELTIERIEVTIDPLIALSQPSAYERIVRSINIIGPELVVRVTEKKSEKSTKFVFPPTVFAALARVDSLKSFSFEDGKFTLLKQDSALFVLHDVRGGIVHLDSAYALSASGKADSPFESSLVISGQIMPKRHSIHLLANIDCDQGVISIPGLSEDSIAMNSAAGQVELKQDSGIVEIAGSAVFRDVEVEHEGESIFLPEARFLLANNIVTWESTVVQGLGTEAISSGSIDLTDSLRLKANLTAELKLESLIQNLTKAESKVSGLVKVTTDISGQLLSPSISASLSSDSILAYGEVLRSLSAQVNVAEQELRLTDCSLISDRGSMRANGVLSLKGERDVSAIVDFEPKTIPKLFGQTSGVSYAEFAIDGQLASPTLRWLARDSSGTLLGNGSAAQRERAWDFSFTNPAGETGELRITGEDGKWKVNALNAHIIVPIVYPRTQDFLSTVRHFEFNFEGDEDSGKSDLAIISDSSQSTVLTRVLQELRFDGSYHRDADSSLSLNGSWHGTSGDAEEFFGQGNITFLDDRFTIDNLYVDETGSLTGSVRIDSPAVDLKMSIEQLPLSRTPFMAGIANKWKLAGVMSGEVSAEGPVDSLHWYADLSLVDGVAQGVPAYWALLTAEGINDRVSSVYASFGRGVKSIFEANGKLDISENTIDVRANFPASDCADFIQALSGKSGLLSGDLDGEVLVFGKLSAPDVVASMRVTNGELLGELAVDRFALDATVSTNSDGSRLLAIPQLSFSKDGKYSFSGELSAEPNVGGPFKAYLEGSGDFLDMLEQVDADFTSLGSVSKLRVEVGGTWDAPQFVGGELSISEGHFTYPPATPGNLLMTTLIHVNSAGVVDSGQIQIDSDQDYLRLEMIGNDDPRAATLEPFVIPSPRIELGILHLSTSANGMLVRLPGFMKPEWLGRLTTGASGEAGITISAYDSTRLRIAGDALMSDARFTFPFISYGGGHMRPVAKWLVDRLYEAWWDLNISMGNGSHYDVEITGFKNSDLFVKMGNNYLLGKVAEYLDHISVDAVVSPTDDPLVMKGSISDSTLRLDGKLAASSGKADYLDQTFWIEKLEADFDETSILPIISGRSATYGVDSVGRTVPVYLTIYEIDNETNTRVPYGRFEDVTYVLEADGYPDPEQVLGLLGYDLTNFSQGKAEQLLTRTAMTAAKRIWLDPISRKLERATFFDEISLAPGGGASASIFRQQRESVLRDTLVTTGAVKFLTGSNVTVGKYFSRDVFLTYTGELAEAAGEVPGGRLGLIHYWNLQYRVVPVSPDFVLDFAVEYDEASRRRDESVALKYSFVLEP